MNHFDSVPLPYAGTGAAAAERVTAFLRAVYGWMFAGLTVTAVVAWLVAGTPSLLMAIASNRVAFWGIVIVQLGMVFYLSARVHRLAPGAAAALFLAYSAVTGVTIAFILLVYTGESVAMAFFIAAGMFGAMAVYGTTTRRSLAGVGQFMFMGLIGLVLASIVGIFWRNDALQFLIAFVGVIVFTGLAAWDAQRLKAMALALPDGRVGAYAIVGALSLYLDFINLFLSLLRLFGGRRD
jgi:FtsH-binding integral membrane protein